MNEQSLPLQLLVLALVYAVATAFHGYLGALAVTIIVLAGAIYTLLFLDNGAMIVGVAAMASPVLFLIALAGVLAGKVARTRWYVLSLAIFLPFGYWHHSIKTKTEEAGLAKIAALDKLKKMPEVLQMAGWSGKDPEISSTSFGTKNQLIRIEFGLDGVIPLYAVFSRDQDATEWKFNCVTKLPMGRRSVHGDTCEQGVIPIGDKRFAHALKEKPKIDIQIESYQMVLLVTNKSTEIDKVVKVNIWAGTKKEEIVLLLASREPVQWDLRDAERPVAAVFLMGHPESSISATGVTPQYIGNLYAEKTDEKSWEVFNNTLFAIMKAWPNRSEFQPSTNSFTIPGR